MNFMDGELRVHFLDENAPEYLGNYIKKIIDDNTVIVCIGTDRCIGDALGPLVGTFLKKSRISIPVYGTLQTPIHAMNLKEEKDKIMRIHRNPKIIAVDACLGEENLIGQIQVRRSPILPGRGIGKSLPSTGNMSIIGIVDKYDTGDFLPIHNIRLSFVMEMAEVIASGIIQENKK